MSLTEAFRSLVSFYQVIGFIPFFIKTDKGNQKHLELSFSFKSFSAWWFILSLVFQILLPLSLNPLVKEVFDEHYSEESIPITLQILGPFSVAVNFIWLILARWLIFRQYKLFKDAFKITLEIEQFFRKSTDHYSNFFRRRFRLGILVTVLLVCWKIQSLEDLNIHISICISK